MEEYLSAMVPRHLMVRASVQVLGARLPARGFMLAAAIAFGCGIAVVVGADLERTVWLGIVLILVAIAIAEGRVWGRSLPAVLTLLIVHTTRRRQLRVRPIFIPSDVFALDESPLLDVLSQEGRDG